MCSILRGIRQALVPVLIGAVVGTPMVGPVLDRDLWSTATAVETEHHPDTCPTPHDHTICVQLASNRWAPSTPAPRPEVWPRIFQAAVPVVGFRASRPVVSTHHPRAPPLT